MRAYHGDQDFYALELVILAAAPNELEAGAERELSSYRSPCVPLRGQAR